ncbi:hypothetical protein [Allomuricauda sp. F6463D]|uniref:hypothetical protein n=1 Tax=Allomuricauda sp. F6463D TaxID=2926409 RepID=UPI001FF1D942|nr:hypothetical protein [Muricauda sp. F6463D]MCK0160590.1 hypothetical protein [Muricauda sp. F6463D]
MKKLINNMLRAALVVLTLSFASCQEEYEEFGGGSEDQTISADSSTATLIENTSSKDGSYDNIVDGASCFAIQFPYTVNVNGVSLTINSESDLQSVEEIFDELDNDNNLLDIVFPIVITLSDYSEINIDNQNELETLARECIENGDDDDIECIDFVYPITLFTFDVQNQLSGDFQVKNDKDMRRFFADLDDDQLISIQFPITLKKYDGTEIVVETNFELAAALETAKNNCDEDDDDDYNDDDFTEEELKELLLDCPLQVRQVIRNEIDSTEQYIERLLIFHEDGTVTFSTFTAGEIMGAWSTDFTDQGVVLSLNFENFTDFSADWYVYQLEEGVVKLYKDESNKIVLKKQCDINPDEIDREAFLTLLKECEWIIKEVKNQGQEIERLLGYEFQFKTDGVVTLGNGVNTMQGTWEIGLNAQYRLSLIISIDDEPRVSFEWPIKKMLDTRLEFEIEATDHSMKLLRVCEDSIEDNDIPEIRNIVMGGTWNVTLFQEGEVDKTISYAGMDFKFYADHQVEVTIINDTILANGLWRVIRDSDEGLMFYINFDSGNDLLELTEDWKVVSVTTIQIELTMENDDGSSDTLVLEKI